MRLDHAITSTSGSLMSSDPERTAYSHSTRPSRRLHLEGLATRDHRLNTNRDWKRGGAAEIRRVMPQNGCISFERAVTQHKNMKDTTNTGSYS